MPNALLTKASLCLLLVIPGKNIFPVSTLFADCDGVKLEIKITPSSIPGRGDIEATVTGGVKPISYHFYKADFETLSKDITSNKLKNIEPGTYFCSILDGKQCVKKTEFKIE